MIIIYGYIKMVNKLSVKEAKEILRKYGAREISEKEVKSDEWKDIFADSYKNREVIQKRKSRVKMKGASKKV